MDYKNLRRAQSCTTASEDCGSLGIYEQQAESFPAKQHRQIAEEDYETRATSYRAAQRMQILEDDYEAQAASSPATQHKVFLGDRSTDPNDPFLTLLHRLVQKGDVYRLSELLSRSRVTQKFIHATNSKGDTLLHTAVRESKHDIVQLLLTKGASIHVRNAEGKTPLQMTNDSDPVIEDFVAKQFNNYLSKLSAKSLRKIDVPEDSNCLFWSVTLAYLFPVRYDETKFRIRFQKLFGHEEHIQLVRNVLSLIRDYNPISEKKNINKESLMCRLVSKTFRRRVVREMFSYQRVMERFTVMNFLRSENENYFTQGAFQKKFCARFKKEIGKNDIDIRKLKPDLLNEKTLHEIHNELDKIPNKKKVMRWMCEVYEYYMNDSNARASYLEIEAISLMLCCNIIVFSEKNNRPAMPHAVNEWMYLFDKGEDRYDFGLVRAEDLIEAMINTEVKVVKDYLSVGVDNINYKHTGGWTALHFAVRYGYSEIITLLVNAGAEATMRDLLNQTPKDVAAAYGSDSSVDSFLSTKRATGKLIEWKTDCVSAHHPYRPIRAAEHVSTERITASRKLCHTELLMFLLLQALQKQIDGKITNFSLQTEDHEVFSDIIFRYKYKKENGVEKSKITFLQASMWTSGMGTVSVDKLCSDLYYGLFSLKRYLRFYCGIKRRLNEIQNDPLFEITLEDLDCEFVMYTNSPSTFQEDENKDIIKVPVGQEDLLCWERELGNRHYWKLNLDGDRYQKLTDILRSSSECRQLAKGLLMCALPPSKGNALKLKFADEDILRKYRNFLSTKVIKNVTGKKDKCVFREKFLNSGEIFLEEDDDTITFREALFEEAEKISKKSERQMKLELKGRVFQVPFEFQTCSQQAGCPPLPDDFISQSEMKLFLTKLKMFVHQLDQTQLYQIIKHKIQSACFVEENDSHKIFFDVKRKLEEMFEAGRLYITHRDTVFQNCIKIALFSKVKNLDKIHHLVQNDSTDYSDGNGDAVVLLHFAAGAGHFDIVKFLVKEDIDINHKCFSQETALYNAIRNNHYNIVKFLVENKAELNILNERSETPLHLAAALGRTEIMRFLTNEDVDLNVRDKDGNAPLHYAAKQGNIAILQMLLEKDSDIDAFDNNGKTVLQVAVEAPEENFEVVVYLVEKNAVLNSVDKDGWTLLHSAAYFGRPNVIEFLLGKGIDVNARNCSGETALHLASMSSNKDIIKSLLKKGGNIHAVDCNGKTFLDLITEEIKQSVFSLKEYKGIKLNPWYENGELVSLLNDTKNVEQVLSLLENTMVDINAENSPDGETVLFLSIRKGITQLVNLFLDKGADIYVRNDIGETALHIASRTGNSNIVQLLLDKGIDASGRNHHGETALHEASRVGDAEAVAILFQHDPKAINNRTAFGDTALHNATVNGHLEIMEFLLSKGAKVDSMNLRDETPLHFASIAGNDAAVKVLFEHGASIDARDYKGNTPLHVASMKGKQEVVQILLDRGAVVSPRNFSRETPLHLAYNREVMKLLIHSGADIRAKTSNESLHYYAKTGKTSKIRDLLKDAEKNGENIEECVRAQDDAGTQPIHLAAREGHRDVVSLLLEKGASVDAVDYSGLQPVHLAAREGHVDVIHFLLERAGNVNIMEAEDHSGMMPIHLAAREGHRDAVEFFLNKNEHLKDVKSAAEITPLLLTAKNLHVNIINILLNKNASTDVKDKSGQTFLHYFACGLYSEHKVLVGKTVLLITIIGENVEKHPSTIDEIYQEIISGFKCQEELSSEIQRIVLDAVPGLGTLLGVYRGLRDSAVKSVVAVHNVFKGKNSDFVSTRSEIVEQIEQIANNRSCSSNLEIVLLFPKFLLFALDVSLSKSFLKNDTISDKQLDHQERLLIDFSKVLTEYKDYLDDIINTKKEKLENLITSGKQTNLENKLTDLSEKLNNEMHVNTVCDVSMNALLSGIIEDYIKLTDLKHLGQQRNSEESIQKLSVQRALQIIGDKQAIEILKDYLDDETTDALKKLRNNYLSHSDERSKVFARVMAEYKFDAFDVNEDLRLLFESLTTEIKGKIQLKMIETLSKNLKWLSEKDKKLQSVVTKLQTLEASIIKRKYTLLEETGLKEISSLYKEMDKLKHEVKEYVCGVGGDNFKRVHDQLDKYTDHLLKDNSSEWKIYLGISFFNERLKLLRNDVLRDSFIEKNLRENFTYTINQTPIEKTVTYLRKYKKSQAGTEFLIFELRNILTDTFRSDNGDFDKRVAEKVEKMIGNRWLRNFLKHLGHGSSLCHELTDLARVVAYDAHMFMDKGEAISAFKDLSFRIRKDKKKWTEDNKSRDLFTMLLDSSCRVELLNAVKDVTGDITLLREPIEDFLGNLNDKEFRSMVEKFKEKIGLLKIFWEATADSQKKKLKGKVKGYLRDLDVEEFTEVLVNFSKQNNFLEILEKIMGPQSLAKEVTKYLSNPRLHLKKMRKSENFKGYIRTLRQIAEHCPMLSKVLEDKLVSEGLETR